MTSEVGRILVVDDTEAKRYVVGRWLRKAGHEVVEADTGTAALAMLGTDLPDLVLLDVELPDLTGYEVCEAIKADPRTASVPVVHLSAARVEASDRATGLTRGADAYLTDPVDPDELLASVQATLRYSRARRHAERMASRLARLTQATLRMNTAASFHGLLRLAALGSAGVFDGPAVVVAVSPDGDCLRAVATGPADRPVLSEFPASALAELARDEATGQVSTAAEVPGPASAAPEEALGLPAGVAARWVAARPRSDRPPGVVAVPAATVGDEADALLGQLGQAIGLAVETMRAYDEERGIALTLQRSLLPGRLPPIPGVDVAVRYVPASPSVEVGGDFYELLEVGGRVLAVIGDVGGHSLHAATVMAELRHAARAYSLDSAEPAVLLDRLNELIQRFHPDEIATACIVSLDPATGAAVAATAGHLPPLLVTPDGAQFVPVVGPLLGIPASHGEPVEFHVPPGGVLVMVTDGLVERRTEPLQAGLDDLRRLAATVEDDLERFCDRLVVHLGPLANDDDTALMAIRRR